MGDLKDKVTGRAKQATGAVTGDDALKRQGERDERKGEMKEGVDDAIDSAQDKLDDLRDKAADA
jgi:uncharacterized protein YjbJ (UPF0337 family)